MNSKHKIVVFKMREILYTLLLLFLLIVLSICLIRMFTTSDSASSTDHLLQSNISSQTEISLLPDTGSTNDHSTQSDNSSIDDLSTQSDHASASVYAPGIYTSSITLGASTVDVEVSVDSDQIRAIRLVNLSEAAAASFPLVSPSLQNIADQILASQSLEGITCPQENKYTSQVLLSAIADALTLAKNSK